MVRIRMRRMGKKKQPFYRIVAVDSRGRRDGKYIEKIGYYNPIRTPKEVLIDEEKALKWLKQGAIPSDTVKSFLKHKGILLRFDLMKKGFDEAAIVEELKKWELLQLERQRRLEAKAAQSARKDEKKEEKQDDKESILVSEPQVEQAESEAPAVNSEATE